MSLSHRLRLFSVSSFQTQEKKEIKQVEPKLPPQIKSRVAHHANQKMMSDFAIGKIKLAVLKIIDDAQLVYKSQHPEATQAELDKLKFRRFRKEEIEAALGKKGMEEIKDELVNGKLPYGVYHAKIVKHKTEKEIFAFINKGMKELIEKAKKEGRSEIEVEETLANIFGIGAMGIVKAMHDMDDRSRCYALKIIRKSPTSDEKKFSEEEYYHAAQAGLALARFVRPSPSHNGELQEEILMEYIPGVNLETFFNPLREDSSKEPLGSSVRPLELLVLLQKMAISVQESVHQFGSIHCDIKLSNFIYNPDTGAVTLVDYGISVTPAPGSKGIYVAPHTMGTPGYIAQEVSMTDSYSQKSDVFALGTAMALMLDMIEMPELKAKFLFFFTPFKLSATATPAFIKKIPDGQVRSYLESLLLLMRGRQLDIDLTSEMTEEQAQKYCKELLLVSMLRPTVKECIEVLENIIKLQRSIDMGVESGLHKAKIEELFHDLKLKYSESTIQAAQKNDKIEFSMLYSP